MLGGSPRWPPPATRATPPQGPQMCVWLGGGSLSPPARLVGLSPSALAVGADARGWVVCSWTWIGAAVSLADLGQRGCGQEGLLRPRALRVRPRRVWQFAGRPSGLRGSTERPGLPLGPCELWLPWPPPPPPGPCRSAPPKSRCPQAAVPLCPGVDEAPTHRVSPSTPARKPWGTFSPCGHLHQLPWRAAGELAFHQEERKSKNTPREGDPGNPVAPESRHKSLCPPHRPPVPLGPRKRAALPKWPKNPDLRFQRGWRGRPGL